MRVVLLLPQGVGGDQARAYWGGDRASFGGVDAYVYCHVLLSVVVRRGWFLSVSLFLLISHTNSYQADCMWTYEDDVVAKI